MKPSTLTVGECGCPDLAAMLGDAPYVRPDLDAVPPPWVDPAVPESYEFAGLLITEIGLEPAQVERTVTDRIGDGGVIGPRRYGPRVIPVTGLLIGSTCCGIDYGLRWLASALRGSMACGPADGCSGDDLEYLLCCPCCKDPDVPAGQCASRYWRTLRDVALSDGPRKTGTVGSSCSCRPCPAVQVEFTLTAARPYALHPPITVTEPGETWEADDAESGCVTWSHGPGCVEEADECAARPATCLEDALAVVGCAPTAPPQLPVPINPCVCEPLTRRRHCVQIPSSVLTPIWTDVVPDIEIYAGSRPLRNVRVRFYPNPLQLGIDDLDPCGFCAEINVTVIPASSTLRIDGTREVVTVACPGSGPAPAGGVVTGASGGPWRWPVLDCGTPYVACFEADAATIADDAAITVRVVSREV